MKRKRKNNQHELTQPKGSVNKSKNRRQKMPYGNLKKLDVSEDNLKAWIIHGLHSMRLIPMDFDVATLKFGDADTIARTNGLIPLHIKFAEEVTIIRHNG